LEKLKLDPENDGFLSQVREFGVEWCRRYPDGKKRSALGLESLANREDQFRPEIA